MSKGINMFKYYAGILKNPEIIQRGVREVFKEIGLPTMEFAYGDTFIREDLEKWAKERGYNLDKGRVMNQRWKIQEIFQKIEKGEISLEKVEMILEDVKEKLGKIMDIEMESDYLIKFTPEGFKTIGKGGD